MQSIKKRRKKNNLIKLFHDGQIQIIPSQMEVPRPIFKTPRLSIDIPRHLVNVEGSSSNSEGSSSSNSQNSRLIIPEEKPFMAKAFRFKGVSFQTQ